MYVSLVNAIKNYTDPSKLIGVSAIDLDINPMTEKLYPLTSISNLE